jgi:hypothetical protein
VVVGVVVQVVIAEAVHNQALVVVGLGQTVAVILVLQGVVGAVLHLVVLLIVLLLTWVLLVVDHLVVLRHFSQIPLLIQ